MPFEMFDRSQLRLKPLAERVHDVVGEKVWISPDEPLEAWEHPALPEIAQAIVAAKRKRATTLMMYGAHVIRSGCAPVMIRLMEEGWITHFATNGAGGIHDFELAMIGQTCESVARYVQEGQFGLWNETGKLNDILREGMEDGLGAGEAIGRYIWENRLPFREKSLLANGYRLQIPCTIHIGIGNDILHEHPNCDGAVLGETSYRDFLIYTQSVTRLENGVFLNFGSAVTGPEVYLKALAMARNVAHQRGEFIRHFTTAVFDMQRLPESDYHTAPDKSDPRYYFRPWKTILARTVADGGQSFYVCGQHQQTLPHLARWVEAKKEILEEEKG
ncbi:MAG: hypothetical protein Q4E67_06165 [Planctomycetia bacterium]|nr:hypothetical protein [Planctomycetia bacterium]